MIDPTSGEQTEINERGPAVSPEEVKRLFDRIGYLAGGAKICVLAGSLPPGAGDDLYARLIDDLRRRGVPVVLDAEGEAMLAGLRAGASMVTPNEREAEELVGQEFADRGDLATGPLRAGPPRRRRGGDHAAGRLRRGGRRGLRAAPPRGPHRAAGAGLDGRLGRRLRGRLRRRPLRGSQRAEECLAYGVACGAESTQHFGAGIVDRNQVERLLGEVARPRFGGPRRSVG